MPPVVRVLAPAVVCGVVLASVVEPNSAAAALAECAKPGTEIKGISWAQRAMAPDRLWPFTRGEGVAVAVLDSGVDANQPGLRGRVRSGFDAAAGRGSANNDCLGTGTQVAGVIAGAQRNPDGFGGLAPAATLLPVRVISPQHADVSSGVDPAVLARGIHWAVDQRADIIDVSVPTYTDDAALRSAVARAIADNVLVVAAVGDGGDSGQGKRMPYPAAYEGVVGVGAIDNAGLVSRFSQRGDFVDLVAPGEGVVTLQRVAGMATVDGTSIAAGLVSGVAALVAARQRGISGAALARQLLATVAPAPSWSPSDEYGYGIVDPYAAVHEHVVVERQPFPSPEIVRRAAVQHSRGRRAWFAVIGGAAAVVVVVLAAGAALPSGRRRRWRPVVAAPLAPRIDIGEPGPPILLFPHEPRPRDRRD